MQRSITAALACLLLLCAAPLRAQGDATVVTKDGPVRGVTAGPVTKYLGIPYAAPPVGALRWQPPAAPQPWSAVRDANSFGARCPQTPAVGEFSAPSATEDCLFLNVFAPAASSGGKPRAVMVWIPGGGFFAGGSNDYDATALVGTGDVVLVTLNYRVGLLGFLAQTDLDGEGHAFADYGLLDQRQALTWVRDNIAAFGGDPGNVTIFGESAGAISVYAHLAAPGSKGLFHRAIMESGFTDFTRSPLAVPRSVINPLAGAVAAGDGFAKAVGCTTDVAACLRRLPVQTIIEKQMPFISGLILDGSTVPTNLDAVLADGSFNQVPILNGTNHDEWRWPVARTELVTGKPLTAERFPTVLGNFFGDATPKVAAEYPLGKYGSPSEALAAAETDGYFSCGAIRNDAWMARHVPVYGYEFNDTHAPMYMPPASFPYGAAHTSELQFIFPGFHGGRGVTHPLTPAEDALSGSMVRYWANFAKTGDPNGADLPRWPRFTSDDQTLLSLDVPAPAPLGAAFGADHRCAFWSALLH